MQRRAAAVYVGLFVVVAVASFGTATASSAPAIDISPDHELSEGDSVTLGGTTYTVDDVSSEDGEEGVTWSATIQWADGNESTTVSEGTNVTLGGTTYTSHFEGDTLQLTSDQQAYMNEVRDIEAHEEFVHHLEVLATLSGLAAVLLAALSYMPVRGD